MSISLAIVIPWYGPECNGGAERLARELAVRLASRGQRVDVLTTCCRTFFANWSRNHHRPGRHEDDLVVVRRFLVAHRDTAAFSVANDWFLRADPHLDPGAVPLEVETTFLRSGIRAPGLVQFLSRHAEDYDAVIGLPYCFGLVLEALAAVGDRALLIPCLHDEAYARMAAVRQTIIGRACAWNSVGEQELAQQLYGVGRDERHVLVGTGVEPVPAASEADRPMDIAPGRFVLALGRRDATKGVDDLIAAWRTARIDGAQLVLAGPGEGSRQDPAARVADLGLVPDGQRAWLLRNCRALAIPSLNESFSRVMYEAWSVGRPVLVDQRCLATATAVRTCGGGYQAADGEEWSENLRQIFTVADADLDDLGSRGQAHAAITAGWDACLDRMEKLVGTLASHRAGAPGQPPRIIHQLITALSLGDAVSEAALNLDAWLRDIGVATCIHARYIDPALAKRATPLLEAHPPPEAALLYHHSIGSPATPIALHHPGPKAIIYHNITPPAFFQDDDAPYAKLLAEGLAALPALAQAFPVHLADSAFNLAEFPVAEAQYRAVLPLLIPHDKWRTAANGTRHKGGRGRLLFVGRFAPNKRQDLLLQMLRLLRDRGLDLGLDLVGKRGKGCRYAARCITLIDSLGLTDVVTLHADLDEEALARLFQEAVCYVSASEHEGFGVPLVEAMHFDLPIVARSCAAVPETLADAGVLVDPAGGEVAMADAVAALLADSDLHRDITARRRQRRADFTDAAVHAEWRRILSEAFTLRPSRAQHGGIARDSKSKPRVAIVVQRCGEEVAGGAEALALSWAKLMATGWDLEVLTTCAKDHYTWANDYPEGPERIGGVTIRRFRTDHGRSPGFNDCSEELLARGNNVTVADAERWMALQGPVSTGLLNHLRYQGDGYDAVVFVGYLYATTWFGLPLVADRAWLAGCVHDEWCVHFPFWAHLFRQPRGMLYLSHWERDFVAQRFPTLVTDGPVIGAPIIPPDDCDPDRFREAHGIEGPYVLYLGRVDPMKGCDGLVATYLAALERNPDLPLLVLAGKIDMPIPAHPRIIATGFVSDEARWDAISGCAVLVNPSPHESLSLVLLEAWAVGRPTLVTESCPVTTDLTRRSRAGTTWRDDADFLPQLRRAMEMRSEDKARCWIREETSPSCIRRRIMDALGLPGTTGP